jgi:hypothetical protein
VDVEVDLVAVAHGVEAGDDVVIEPVTVPLDERSDNLAKV